MSDPLLYNCQGYVDLSPRKPKQRKRREIAVPKIVDTSRLCSAQHVRWYVAENPALRYLTDAELGEKLGLSAGYVGMILSGARPPTKKFLKAIGWESVTLYQMKRPSPTVSRPHLSTPEK